MTEQDADRMLRELFKDPVFVHKVIESLDLQYEEQDAGDDCDQDDNPEEFAQ